ncbi:hypothetical protein STBHUCCB_7720 [Salmonella enterica subsp. enterica serovar Typhi str. P-stx-12]|nr:hypothetical protein STBHUCCB_7720 [Salmonella enterica subsp. enterica serovar Typhi str. P-stx-12]AXR55526.1 hypothetical protein CJP42_1803 [Salmonella enterica subsp. enterica serovar Typhi]
MKTFFLLYNTLFLYCLSQIAVMDMDMHFPRRRYSIIPKHQN